MKKRLVNALLLAMSVAVLGGCSKGQTAQDMVQSSTQETTQQTTQEVGQTAERTGLLSEGQKASDFVTLGEYKGLNITAQEEIYGEEEIELETKEFYFTYITAEDGVKDRPVENLDMTNIDYEGKKDGVAFAGGTAQGATLLIGSGSFIGGFEEGLIGVMPGETVDLNLTFPENYGSAELAGQDVVFTVKVNFIPEMEDERVSEIGIPDVSTVDELRAYVREGLAQEYLSAVQDEVWMQLMETTVFNELPEEMLAKSREEYAGILDQMAASWGIDVQTYAQLYGTTYEDLLDQYAEVYAQQILVVQAVADAEDLNISEEKLAERINDYAEESGTTVDVLLSNGLTNEDFRQSFLYEDVMNFLVDNATTN